MPQKIDNPLMRNIQAHLDRLGISAEFASRKAGLHRDFIRNIRRGISKSPGSEQLKQIAVVLGCGIEDLLRDVPEGVVDFLPNGTASDEREKEWLGFLNQVEEPRKSELFDITRAAARALSGRDATAAPPIEPTPAAPKRRRSQPRTAAAAGFRKKGP